MTCATVVSEGEARQEQCWRHEARELPGLEVIVLGVKSPLETGSLFGRGHGVLAADRSVAATFLLGHHEFVSLRDKVLSGVTEISLSVQASDVTAVEIRDVAPASSASLT